MLNDNELRSASELIRRGYNYWLSRITAGQLPSRKDIDPSDMKSLLSNLVLMEVRQDPLDFVERITGDTILHHSQRNSMRIPWSEIPGRGPGSQIWTHFETVVTTKAPLFASLPNVGPHADFLEVQLVSCPLADDGENVNRVLSFVDFPPRHKTP